MTSSIVGRIEEAVLKATVKIQNSAQSLGTGFVVSKPSKEKKRYFFLITNKHLIGKYNLIEGKLKSFYDYLIVDIYRDDGSIQKVKIELKDQQGSLNNQKVFPYPEPYIDLVIISIADDLNKIAKRDLASFDLSYLLTDTLQKKWNVNIGDQVFALGYPHDIYSRSNNYPIAKSGYIASKMGEELSVVVNYNDRGKSVSHRLEGKIMLLDGTLVGGNSGGPIILPHERRERTNKNTGKVEFSSTAIPNLVLGVQSQSLTEAGISFAFSSEYILELINGLF
jgi:hypothetical protein